MDRITYFSKFGRDVTFDDIREIGRKSEANNERDDLSGALICFNGVFYQIIEGDPVPLYRCFERIQSDPRHEDIFILNIERDISSRLYPEWRMRTVFLEEKDDPLMTPIRNLLSALTHTHGTLKKYAPIEVLDGIQQGLNPLDWGMEHDEKIVLFSDLVAFSTLMENASANDVKQVLNKYFEVSFSAVKDSGGTISKLMGDGFLAYYPISHASDALRASARIMSTLKQVRADTKSPYLKYSYGSIGLSAGPVVKGNIGSLIKMDYTVLGDVVNSAARLESHTRKTGYSILFDHRFKSYLPADVEFKILQVGSLTPKGKSAGFDIYSLDHPFVEFEQSPEEIATALRSV